jgi:hypothetical protein
MMECVAAKDAARHWLGQTLGVPSFPVEITLVPDGTRRFRVESHLIPDGHDLRVTLSSLPMTPDTLAVTVAVIGEGEYRDIEARRVRAGADPDAVAAEAAGAVAARNPGARVARVPRPENDIPSTLADVPDPPPFAVAWTAARG